MDTLVQGSTHEVGDGLSWDVVRLVHQVEDDIFVGFLCENIRGKPRVKGESLVTRTNSLASVCHPRISDNQIFRTDHVDVETYKTGT